MLLVSSCLLLWTMLLSSTCLLLGKMLFSLVCCAVLCCCCCCAPLIRPQTPQSPILLGADVVESKRGSVVLQRASSSGHDLQALMDSPRATRSATGSLPPANERRKFDDLLGSPVRSPSTPTHSHGGSSGGAQHKKGTWPALGSLMTPSTGTPSSVNPWTLAKCV